MGVVFCSTSSQNAQPEQKPQLTELPGVVRHAHFILFPRGRRSTSRCRLNRRWGQRSLTAGWRPMALLQTRTRHLPRRRPRGLYRNARGFIESHSLIVFLWSKQTVMADDGWTKVFIISAEFPKHLADLLTQVVNDKGHYLFLLRLLEPKQVEVLESV